MNLEIIPVFCNEKNMANYAYLVKEPSSNQVIIVDAAETKPILQALEKYQLTPTHILTTHHHFDHVGANIELKQQYNLEIMAPQKEFSQIPGADTALRDNENIEINNIIFHVFEAPGHTKGHVLYYIPKENMLFTGDVLFNLCIGGLFEGSPDEMYTSLQKIKQLPDVTLILPGHEYTHAGISQQLMSDPRFQPYLKKYLERQQGLFSPSTLKEEKTFNPYLQIQTLTEFLGQ